MDQKTNSEMIDHDAWRETMSAFASGVTIVASPNANKQPQGMTVSVFCSLLVDLPLLLIYMNPDRPTYSHIKARKQFLVNILEAGREALSNKYAMAADEERFNNVKYTSFLSGSVEIRLGSDRAILLVYWQRAY